VLISSAHRAKYVAACFLVATAFTCPKSASAVDLFFQNFEGVPLGPIVTYATELREREAWSATPPAGWVADNSAMPAAVVSDPNSGASEFEGWTIVNKNWWVATSGDQGRAGFLSANGKVAVADTDEHDDFGSPVPSSLGPFDAKIRTPSIPLLGAAPSTANVTFRSSWMPEEIQKATVTAIYNNGANVEVLRWHSPATDPLFHASNVNETVTRPLQNPTGATSVMLEFRMFDATNNWWWAIDDISVYTGGAPTTDGVLRAVVDRNSSNVKIVNNTGQAVSLRGYSLRSAAGAFNEANAAFLADSNANWVQLTTPNATSDLSEGHLSSFNLANGGTINFGNNVWRKYYQDTNDLTFQYLVAGNDNPVPGIIEFTGNGNVSFPFLDLNFSGAVEIGDWDTFRAGFPVSLAGLSTVQRYQLGDLDNDGQHTPTDFLRFRSEYDAALGAGAFEAALATQEVPEPATIGLFLSATLAIFGVSRNRNRRGAFSFANAAAIVFFLGLSATTAQAQLTLFTEDFEDIVLGPSIEEAVADDNVWTDTPPAGWVLNDSGVPGLTNPPENNGKIEWAGWAFTDKVWWSTNVDGQLRETFSRGSGTVMVADPDEWDDEPHPSGLYGTFITTPTFTIPAGIPAGKIKLAFDSSWRPEGNDDDANLANDQRATVKVSYNGGAPLNAMTWTSISGAQTFHPDAPNEAVLVDLQYNGSSTNMNLTFGLDLAENDWWWAVDNIRVFVPANPSILRVNLTSGQMSVLGGDVIPVPINYIDITSANGVLNGASLSGLSTRTPDSVDGTDPDTIPGSSSGEKWQVLSATDNRLTEAFLLGSSTFLNSRNESLGAVFDTSTSPANRDIIFTYTTIFGDIVNGLVQYFVPAGVNGDYNNNGVVDAADYVLWRKHLNTPTTLPNDSTPGVALGDYTVWRTNFGRTASGSGASLSAVPEPATSQLALVLVFTFMLAGTRRSIPAMRWCGQLKPVPVSYCAILYCVGTMLGFGSLASAAVPPPPVLDRNYRMGDDPTEGAVSGSSVSTTFDSAGLPGMQQFVDLQGVNGPRYEALPTSSGGPVPRRPDNGAGMAIRLNPTGAGQVQHLKTGFEQALNFPERSWSSTFTPGGTIDYSFIRDRGFQLWVLPQTAARADVVMDTNQHGALINANGRFAMRYINTDYDTGVSVTANTWYHLMVVRPFGPDLGSIMYVNGRAVAAASGAYAGENNPALEETTPLVVGANTSNVAFQVGFTNRFQGLVDDLEMFVMGLNGPPAPDEFGEFIFERDNKYAAFFKPANAADLTNDNIVNMSDVNVFVANWLYQNSVSSRVIGDLTSRSKGDLNFDGFVNLADWEILNDLAPPGVGSAAWALIQGIPEPGSIFLVTIAAAGTAIRRPTRRPARR
jgi:hypothetical protein